MAVDLSKLNFYSGNRYEYVSTKGSSAFSVAGGGFGSTTITIPHGLGYKPYCKAWYTLNSTGKYYQLFAGPGSYNVNTTLDGIGLQVSNVYADTTNLVFFFENFGVPAVTGTVYYRIYAERQA